MMILKIRMIWNQNVKWHMLPDVLFVFCKLWSSAALNDVVITDGNKEIQGLNLKVS